MNNGRCAAPYNPVIHTTLNRIMRRVIISLLSLCVCTATNAAGRIPLFDVHSHYKAEDAARYSPSEVIDILDREGIERMVLIGEPARRALAFDEVSPGRVLPFLGLYESYRDKADWSLDVSLPARLRAQLEAGDYAGIGEIHLFAPLRHSPVFRAVVGLAGEYKLPLLVHGDPAVVDQVFIWNPQATVIWAHLGTDPRPVVIREMLTRHPQRLFIDTSVRDQRFITDDGLLRPEWRALFIDHAERLLVAIDTFSTSRWENIGKVTARIRAWLAQLPPEVAARLAHGNARRLFGEAPPTRPAAQAR